jgi:hypothetical protein
MKKLVFMFVAVAAISFASCGGNQAQQAPVDADTIAAVEDSVVEDTLAADSVEAPADSAAVAE